MSDPAYRGYSIYGTTLPLGFITWHAHCRTRLSDLDLKWFRLNWLICKCYICPIWCHRVRVKSDITAETQNSSVLTPESGEWGKKMFVFGPTSTAVSSSTYVCLFICPFARPSFHLSVCPTVCLPLCVFSWVSFDFFKFMTSRGLRTLLLMCFTSTKKKRNIDWNGFINTPKLWL